MRLLLVSTMCIGLFLIVACSPSASTSTASPPQNEDNIVVLPALSEITVGEHRVSFGVFTQDGAELVLRDTSARLYFMDAQNEIAKGEYAAHHYQLEVETPHLHEGNIVHPHVEVRGFYLIERARFDKAGYWRLVVTGQDNDGKQLRGSLAFEVTAGSTTPAVGAPAPKTRNKTAADVRDLGELTSRTPPEPLFHRVSVAQAMEAHRPVVVAFATPAFCVSRMCGPVLDIVRSVAEQVGDVADFVQIEPYDLNIVRTQGRLELVPEAKQWSLRSEPWVFVVGKDGKIVDKLEGLITPQELITLVQRAAR